MKKNPFLGLKTTILNIAAEGPPNRRLKVKVNIDNSSDLNCALLYSWTQASFNPGGIAAEGALFEQHHAQAHEAILGGGSSLNGDFSVPISPQLIERVENQRGNNVAFQLKTRFLFAPVYGEEEKRLLGAPWETYLRGLDGQVLGHEVPQSEWIKYLREWQWREIELFEFPFDSHCESPQFKRAFGLLRIAEERLHNGDFPGVLQSSRQALESLGIDASENGDLKKGFEILLKTHVSGEEKGRRIDGLIKALSNVGHFARHEERPHEDIYRKDAVLILRCTLALVQHLTSPPI